MNNLLIKLKHVYLPFLIVGICYIAIYSLLNYLLVIRFELLSLDDDVIDLWLPFILIWVPVLLILRPRIKLLKIKTKRGDMPGLYYFVMGAAIAIPTMIAQAYLPTATGQLTKLSNVADIKDKPATRYYQLSNYHIDKKHVAYYTWAERSGKNNEYLDFYIDVICPIEERKPVDTIGFDFGNKLNDARNPVLVVIDNRVVADKSELARLNSEDVKDVQVLKAAPATALYGQKAKYGALIITTKNNGEPQIFANKNLPQAWLGIEYKEQVSSSLNDKEQQEAYQKFNKSTNLEFASADLNKFTYLERPGNNAKHRAFEKAFQTVADSTIAPVILEARQEPFSARNGDKFYWTFASFGIGSAIILIMVMIPGVNRSALKASAEGGNRIDMGWVKDVKDLLQPSSPYFATAMIVSVNLLVFISMVLAGFGMISFDAGELLTWGANYRPYVQDGQWWRLLTSAFMHGGLMHILGNFYGLFFVAIFLEPKLNKWIYTGVYLLCGLAGSLASIWWHPATISVGASGAIFGLYGVFTALLTTSRAEFKANKFLLINNAIFIGINLLVGLKGGVDNAAHVGGLACGIIAGYVLYFYLPKPKPKRKYTRRAKTLSVTTQQPEDLPNL